MLQLFQNPMSLDDATYYHVKTPEGSRSDYYRQFSVRTDGVEATITGPICVAGSGRNQFQSSGGIFMMYLILLFFMFAYFTFMRLFFILLISLIFLIAYSQGVVRRLFVFYLVYYLLSCAFSCFPSNLAGSNNDAKVPFKTRDGKSFVR